MRPTICAVFLLVIAANSLVRVSESGSITSYVSSTKSALYKKVSDGLLKRSTLVKNLNQALVKIRARYDEAIKEGKLEGLDESEQSAFYYRIVIDEIKRLRNKYALEGQPEDEAVDKFAAACTKCAIDVEKNIKTQFEELEMQMEEEEEEEEEELENELEQSESLEHQLEYLDREAEMGWSLDPESKANLKARTKSVLADLLTNEVKTLVSIIVTSYMGGLPIGCAIGPLIAAVGVSLKSKVFQYVMQSLMDMLGNLLGRKIELAPINYQLGVTESPSEGTTTPVAPETA